MHLRSTRFFVAALALSCADPSPRRAAPSSLDAGIPTALVGPVGTWTWVPVDGSECARGARAGLGVNFSREREDLFIFLQGGGGCWNTGTCAPSLVQFGPVCEYGGACLLDIPGGTKPTATYVDERDPFPADGKGHFPSEVKLLSQMAALDRTAQDNPFRNANFIYVPYCTGDVHSGASDWSYPVKPGLFEPVTYRTLHFSGARNMDAYLARLKVTFPNAKRVWLTGSSAGGFGATLNFERIRAAFPGASVHLLNDSAPFLDNPLFSAWKDAWSMALPQDCPECDAGFPHIYRKLVNAHPTSRFAFLGYDEDPVITWFMFHAPGAASLSAPPFEKYRTAMAAFTDLIDEKSTSKYHVLKEQSHVAWQHYGVVLADGGTKRDRPAVKAFIDAWALGTSDWGSVK